MWESTHFKWLARLFLVLQLLWVPQAAMAAAYAQGGSGTYKNEILWLTWGGGTAYGTSGKAITNGNTTSALIQVTSSTNLQVSCSISDIQSPSGIKSYRPGDWSGDTMDDAYYIGGTGKSNQLIAGIMGSGGPHSFKVTCTSALLTGAASQPVNLRGFVIADAESMAPGEYILGASQGKWSVIERMGGNTSPYYVDKREPTAAAQKIGAAGDSYIKMATKESDGGRGLVTFLQFNQQSAQQSMAFQIKGNGNTAIAIGLLVPFADFGDAPASYNPAMHLIADINFSDDGIGSSGEVNALSPTLPAVKLNPPRTIYLGSTGPDSEPSTPFSTDAKGDDNGGQSALPGSAFYGKEEDAWPATQRISVLEAGGTVQVTMACNAGSAGSATVAGWIDFDQSGSFNNTDERAQGVCSGGRVTLAWPVPAGLKVGKTMARLRIASNPAQIANPDGVADDGEVEDHQIEILGPKLQIRKTASPAATPWSAYSGGPYTYALNVTNIGAVETWTQAQATAIGNTQWKPVTVEDDLPLGVEYQSASGSDWTCTSTAYSPTAKTRVTCTYNLGKSIPAGTAASPLNLTVALHPEIHQSASLVNVAKVYGSLDPFASTDPCDSVHCANARVVVEQPKVVVTKSAVVAPGSTVDVGDTITYTLNVAISGPVAAGKVVLNDFLGAGLAYVTPLPTPAGWSVGAVPSNALDPLVIALDAEPAGTSPAAARTYAFTYQAKVLDSAGATVGNQVRVTTQPPSGGTFEPDISCTSCSTSHTLATPEVRVSKTANPAAGTAVKAGEVIEYTLTAVVSKAKTRDAVVLTDTLGAGLEFGAVTDNSAGAVMGGSGATRTFTLPAGKTPGIYTIKYTAVVKANATTATAIQNRVVPTWQTTPGNNNPPHIGSVGCTSASSCETAHTMAAPDVSVAKTTTAQKARIGDEVDYQVVVTVKDAATTTAMTLIDTLGTGLAYVAGSASGPVTVTALSASSLQLGLPAGTVPGTYRVQYRAIVTSAAVGAVTNGVAITGDGGDPTPTCTTCTTNTPLVISNIKYGKTVNTAGPAKVGDVLTYTVQVDIADAPTAEAIEVDDELGAGLDFVASLPSSAWPITVPVAGKLKATIPANTPVGSYKLIYTVKVLATAQGMLTNKVSMDYNPPGGANPPSCANSCATQTPLADPVVKISKQANTAGPVTVSAASPAIIQYTVTVKVENAALPAAQSQLVDNLGAGLSLVSGSVVVPGAPAWPAMSAGNKTLMVVIPAGTVPGVYTITYDALVTVDAIGQVVNHVNGAPSTGGLTPVCDGPCTVTIPVLRAIDAVDDDYTATTVKGSVGSSYLGNAYRNDTLNGQPVTLQSITGKVDKVEVCTSLSPIAGCSTPTAPVPEMDAASGMVSVPPGTPMGDYLISYTICDQLQPSLCDSAVVKIKVGATITAIDDGVYRVTRGSGKELEVGNAYDNDTLDGWPFSPELVSTTVQLYDPTGAVPGLDPVTGKIKVPPATPAGEYKIPYRICDKLNPSNCANATITVIVTGDESQLRIVKSAAVRTVKIGDLVRYTLKIENVGTTNVVNATVLDTAAPGLSYVAGSLQSSGLGSEVAASGVRPVQFTGVTLEMGQSGTLAYLVRVGAGTQQGALVNKASARNALEETISNIATATVQLTDDPLLDHSLIFGTVFDDRDGDGWQDSAALSGLTAQGGFAPEAYVPGSTTLDRGQGAQPVADASAPLLHGMALGEIAARQSDADPVEKHQLVIRQKLSRLDFTDDFVLTNDQGVTVRMDAAGQTTVTQSGEAAAGRNAAAMEVQRRISATEGGHYVDYVIRSTGVDERGIPGVRIAAVEGLLMETDPFGRFHLVDVQGGAWERGRNFILKVDPSTLPAGAEFTTSNPLLRRITPGLPVRFDFGVKLQPQRIEGGQRWIEIELGTVLFAPGDSQVQEAYLPVLAKVADKLQQYGGGELLVQADGEGQALAFARAEAVRAAVLKTVPEAVAQATQVTVRTQVDDADGLVSGVTADGAVLGTVLFETDKAVVRTAYQPLLAKVAAYLTRQGGGVVYITGHTDVRASHAYNQKLGLQRAQAVYDALLPHLHEEVRKRVRVEPPTGAGPEHPGRKARPVPRAGGVNPVPSK